VLSDYAARRHAPAQLLLGLAIRCEDPDPREAIEEIRDVLLLRALEGRGDLGDLP
jgi:hypothetical protein